LRLRDLQSRQGVMHFRIKGKRDKVRFIPVQPMALRLIGEYLEAFATSAEPTSGLRTFFRRGFCGYDVWLCPKSAGEF
jgi:hypothetical protein